MKTKIVKCFRISFKLLLDYCKRYNVSVIRMFYDYGYKTMYANAIGTNKDGDKVRIETRPVTNQFAESFAKVAKSKGYTVHIPTPPQTVLDRVKDVIKNW